MFVALFLAATSANQFACGPNGCAPRAFFSVPFAQIQPPVSQPVTQARPQPIAPPAPATPPVLPPMPGRELLDAVSPRDGTIVKLWGWRTVTTTGAPGVGFYEHENPHVFGPQAPAPTAPRTPPPKNAPGENFGIDLKDVNAQPKNTVQSNDSAFSEKLIEKVKEAHDERRKAGVAPMPPVPEKKLEAGPETGEPKGDELPPAEAQVDVPLLELTSGPNLAWLSVPAALCLTSAACIAMAAMRRRQAVFVPIEN